MAMVTIDDIELKRGTACINKDGQWVLDTEMPILKGENRDYVNQYIFVGE